MDGDLLGMTYLPVPDLVEWLVETVVLGGDGFACGSARMLEWVRGSLATIAEEVEEFVEEEDDLLAVARAAAVFGVTTGTGLEVAVAEAVEVELLVLASVPDLG